MLGVELKAKLLVVVVEGVPKLVIGFPNRLLDPDCVVAPNPPVIAPKPVVAVLVPGPALPKGEGCADVPKIPVLGPFRPTE